MIVMMVTVYVLGVEFRYHRGKQWLKQAGGSPLKALVGKLLPYTLVLLFVAWWMNYLLFELIGTPLHIPMLNVVLITFALVVNLSDYRCCTRFYIVLILGRHLPLGSGFTAIAFSLRLILFLWKGFLSSCSI